MREQYRLVKQQEIIGDVNNDGFPFPAYNGSDNVVIIRYVVQVKSFIFWHTVKAFKKILPAARLLKHLKGLQG